MRLAFIIHSLGRGGSERQLTNLATGLAGKGHDVVVFVLRGGGPLERELVAGGVTCVNMSRRVAWYRPTALARLVRGLRQWHPDIVHSYLVLPNLLAAGLRPLLRPAGVVWGVRAARDGRYHAFSRAAFAATGVAARIPDLVIVNSRAGRRYHVRRGYRQQNVVVIENGVDTERYRREPDRRDAVRSAWSVPHEAPLIGLVARIDPLKDHETFLRAARELADAEAEMRFVCVGSGPRAELERLQELARALGLADRLTWAGEREDMAAVYSALDICCLSSVSEGFPNVVAEAMACGTPCVVTDVGDAAAIVGSTGVVVAPGDPHSMAAGVRELLSRVERDRDERGAAARDRIRSEYSVARLVQRTEGALREVTPTRRRAARPTP